MCDEPVMWGTTRKKGGKSSVLTVSLWPPHEVPISYAYLFISVLKVLGTEQILTNVLFELIYWIY